VLEGTWRRVAQTGKVRLAYRSDALPFSFMARWKEPVGYTVDICREIVRSMEKQLEHTLQIVWVPVGTHDRLTRIQNGDADLECGSTSNTPARRNDVAFSAPIFVTGTRVMVPPGSPIRRLADLSERNVGVVANTSNAHTLTDWVQHRQPDVRVVLQAGYQQAYEALRDGRIDALAGDEVLLYGLLARNRKSGSYNPV